MNTYIRTPKEIDVTVKNTNQYFHQANFTGIKENDNPVTADKYSFSEANNIYVDDEERLSSRLPLITDETNNYENIVDIITYGDNKIYVTKNATDNTKFDVTLETIKTLAEGAITVLSNVEKYHIASIENYIICFNKRTENATELGTMVFDINDNKGWLDLKNYAKIPITKSVVGTDVNEYEGNLFTDGYEEDYIYKDGIYPILPITTHIANISVKTMHGTLEDYQMPQMNEYTDYKIFRTLGALLSENDIFSVKAGTIAIIKEHYCLISLNNGNTFYKVDYPTDLLSAKYGAVDDTGQNIFFIGSGKVFRYFIGNDEYHADWTYYNFNTTVTFSNTSKFIGRFVNDTTFAFLEFYHYNDGSPLSEDIRNKSRLFYMTPKSYYNDGNSDIIAIRVINDLISYQDDPYIARDYFDTSYNKDAFRLYFNYDKNNDKVDIGINTFSTNESGNSSASNIYLFQTTDVIQKTNPIYYLVKLPPDGNFKIQTGIDSYENYNTLHLLKNFTMTTTLNINGLYTNSNNAKFNANIIFECYNKRNEYLDTIKIVWYDKIYTYDSSYTISYQGNTYRLFQTSSSKKLAILPGGATNAISGAPYELEQVTITDNCIQPFSPTVNNYFGLPIPLNYKNNDTDYVTNAERKYTIVDDDYYYIVMSNGQIYTNRLSDKDIVVIKYIKEPTDNFYKEVPDISLSGNELMIAFGNKTNITYNNRDENGKLLLSMTNLNLQKYIKSVTNLVQISTTETAIFFENNIKICTKVEDNNQTNGYRYDYYNTKLSTGIRQGDSVINTLEGSYTLFPTRRGLASLNYQAFMATTDQVIQYVSDSIEKLWTNFYDNSSTIKLLQWKDEIIITNGTGVILLFNIRKGTWYKWNVPINILKCLTDQKDLWLLSQYIGKNLCVFKEQNIYEDTVNNIKYPIHWDITSNALNLDAPTYYKNLKQLVFNLCDDELGNPIENRIQAKIRLYRKHIKKIKDSDGDEVKFNIDKYGTFVKRFNYWKINVLQWGISWNEDFDNPRQLKMSSISIKYQIGDEVR